MNETGVARLPLWVDDFLIACQLSGEPTIVTGARVKLWCVAFKQSPAGTLPDDDGMLARWAGLTRKEWAAAKPWLAASWAKSKDGRYFIRRVAEEAERILDVQKMRRASANHRWSGERVQSTSNASADAKAMPPPAPAPAPAPAPSPAPAPAPGGSPQTPLPADGQPPPPRKRSGQSTGPPTAAPPDGASLHRGSPPISDADAERIDGLLARVARKYPRDVDRLQARIGAYVRCGGPGPPLERGLASLLEHQAENPWGYLDHVLRVEEPNHHERTATAHSRGMQAIGEGTTLAALAEMARRAAEAGGSGP